MSKRIFTGAGDEGETGFLSGERIAKDDPQVEAYGTVDELISVLGIGKIHSSQKIANYIQKIQETLFYVNTELAVKPDSLSIESIRNLRRITAKDVDELEKIADELSEELPLLRNFVIPGGTAASSFLHLSRTVCRRAERRIISFAKINRVNGELLRYMNRLSDLLFILSRYENLESGDGDTIVSREGIKKMTK